MSQYDFLYDKPPIIMKKDFHHKLNIIEASAKCIKKFEKQNEIVLVAETQSGKTSVMKRLVYLVQKSNPQLSDLNVIINKYDIFVIICSSDTALKTQLQTDLPELGSQIYHLNDLNKIDIMTQNRMAEGLIIFDECHSDAEQHKTIDKFRKKIEKISIELNGNINYHIIGVSATPYEQIKKKYPMVILNPGKNYYGIRDMFKTYITNKKGEEVPIISQAKFLTIEKNCKKLFEEIEMCNRYYIIRLPGDKNSQVIVMCNILKQFSKKHKKIEQVIYDMAYKDDINNLLNTKPKLPTIIYIKDKLRMGKSLNTKYVYIVHDDPQNTHTHTTAQSLIGRCCGYNKKEHQTIIYCDYQKVKQHQIWINSGFSIKKIPHDAKYIMKSTGDLKKICIYS